MRCARVELYYDGCMRFGSLFALVSCFFVVLNLVFLKVGSFSFQFSIKRKKLGSLDDKTY